MTRKLGWILAFTSVVLYSTNSPVARGAIVAGMAPTTLLAGRFLLAAILFGMTYPLAQKWSGSRSPSAKPFDRRGALICIGSGFINGLSLLFLYLSLSHMGAALSSMLMIGLYPLITLALLAFRGENPTWRTGLRLLLGVGGLYFLLGPGGAVSWVGVWFIVLASLLFAIHIVSVQWYLRDYPTWPVTAILVSSAAAMVVVIWIQQGMDTYIPGWIGWGAILLQAVLATYLGRLITYAAINLIGSAQFALLSPLETMLTILWAALFLGERLSGWQAVGAVLILLGTMLAADRQTLQRFFRRSTAVGSP